MSIIMRKPFKKVTENFRLIWLDGSFNEVNKDECAGFLIQLRQIVNNINIFNNVDECLRFIQNRNNETILMILPGFLGQTTVPLIHGEVQVNTIYIFCGNKTRHERWTQQWPKIKGIFTDITSICKALKQLKQYDARNTISISVLTATHRISKQSLSQSDETFMSLQIMKEILLGINFEQKHINAFVIYCRQRFIDDIDELKNLDRFTEEYHQHEPIWWYIRDCFFSSMFNYALCTMDVDLIVKMGFFVRDLHQHISQLHAEQFGEQKESDSFIVYYGHSLSKSDFDYLRTAKHGLLCFNNFLLTKKSDTSLNASQELITNSELINVLFVITIDPSQSSTPFADIRDVSANQDEEEILFSMHSIFRIEDIVETDEEDDYRWEVELTLVDDNDAQVHSLTEMMREETKGSTEWIRLGKLMIKLRANDLAEGIYNMILPQITDEKEKGDVYYQLGQIKLDQERYSEALTFYENSLKIREKILITQHSDIADCYHSIGIVKTNMGEYATALSYQKRALAIQQRILPQNQLDLAHSYIDIGLIYNRMQKYSKARSSCEKAIQIFRGNHPAENLRLATSYINIATLYKDICLYSKAIVYYEKAHGIYEKILPDNHPDLATLCDNIGELYDNSGEYSTALWYYEKALEIYQNILDSNHSKFVSSYNKIGGVYGNTGEYSKALSYYDRVAEILEKTLPRNHPDWATFYMNIGKIYDSMDKYSEVFSYYEKAIKILQKTLPLNYSQLANCYDNIAGIYRQMKNYSKALSYYEKVLEMRHQMSLTNSSDLASSYNSIGWIYRSMSNFSKALSYFERALDIWQRSLPANHRHLYNVKLGIEILKKKL